MMQNRTYGTDVAGNWIAGLLAVTVASEGVRGPSPDLESAQVNCINWATILHFQRNVLNAKRRPSDITLEAHEDNAVPVSNEGGMPRACESLEVRYPLWTRENRRAAEAPHRPESSMVSGMKYCVAGFTRGAYRFRLASSLALAELPGTRADRCLSTLQGPRCKRHT